MAADVQVAKRGVTRVKPHILKRGPEFRAVTRPTAVLVRMIVTAERGNAAPLPCRICVEATRSHRWEETIRLGTRPKDDLAKKVRVANEFQSYTYTPSRVAGIAICSTRSR